MDESLPAGIAPAAAVEQLSLRKALPLNNGAQIVIGADTVVAVDGTILGKPADEAEARQMLARLSGRWHSVFTGVSLVQGERHLTFSCETRVRFFDLTAAEIDAYIATGECMDKAGAYGIQGYGSLLVQEIQFVLCPGSKSQYPKKRIIQPQPCATHRPFQKHHRYIYTQRRCSLSAKARFSGDCPNKTARSRWQTQRPPASCFFCHAHCQQTAGHRPAP